MPHSFSTIAYKGAYIHSSIQDNGKEEVRIQYPGMLMSERAATVRSAKVRITRRNRQTK